MPQSLTKLYAHLIFSTKHRQALLDEVSIGNVDMACFRSVRKIATKQNVMFATKKSIIASGPFRTSTGRCCDTTALPSTNFACGINPDRRRCAYGLRPNGGGGDTRLGRRPRLRCMRPSAKGRAWCPRLRPLACRGRKGAPAGKLRLAPSLSWHTLPPSLRQFTTGDSPCDASRLFFVLSYS